MLKKLFNLFRYKELIRALVIRDLKVRYKKSVLGYAWTWLDPLMTMFAFILVFDILLDVSTEYFPIYLLSGLIPWIFFSNSVITSVESITNNADLLKRVYFPREILSITLALGNLINMLLSLIVIIPLILAYHIPITFKIFLVPIPIFFLFFFSLGVSFFFSCLNVFFRDISYIAPFIVRLWFFITPIFYVLEGRVPPKYLDIYMCGNPLAVILSFFRASLMNHDIPAIRYSGTCFAICISVFGLGYLFFKINEGRMIKRI